MRIDEFRIQNFRCFQDTGPIQLSEGMNIVSGQNNAGKTALLRALELRFARAPHRSISTLPIKGQLGPSPSRIELTYSLSGKEFGDLVRHRDVKLEIPSPGWSSLLPLPGGYNPEHFEALWGWILGRPKISLQARLTASSTGPLSVAAIARPSHNLFEVPSPSGDMHWALHHQLRSDGSEQFAPYQRSDRTSFNELAEFLMADVLNRVYRFSAERFSLGVCPVGINEKLTSDAANLPEVLNKLQADPASFEIYISLVREVLPQVKWISVEAIEDQRVRIDVWNLERTHRRKDLAIPLSESGTGVGQVLSIIYVVFTSEDPCVLLIDEPQSFLHPGAARKLIEVLRRFPQHQYVISTHSSAVIAAAETAEILILSNSKGSSQIEVASIQDAQRMRAFLDEVGTRLSDVFGMDRVIWVEGPTEEKAYPLLIRRLGRTLAGTAVVSVRNTGDLEGRDKKKALEIYRGLSSKASILPPNVVFILDAETRTDAEKKELDAISDGKVRFLPRRMFENYLLRTEAICAVINDIPGFSEGEPIQEKAVEQFLASAYKAPKYWAPFDGRQPADRLNEDIDAASVLSDLFRELSATRVSYQKTKHSLALFEWLLQHCPEDLEELSSLLADVLDTDKTDR